MRPFVRPSRTRSLFGDAEPVERPVGSLIASSDGVFRQQDGKVFQWRGCTDFLLYQRYLNNEDITPILRERVELGANIVRVLGMVTSFAHFWPQEHVDYYEHLAPFTQLLASFGLRLEFVVFADANVIMPDRSEEWDHLTRVIAELAPAQTAVIEVCNEPFANIPGGDLAATTLAQQVQGMGVLVSSGAYEWLDGEPKPTYPAADYGTHHADRGDHWPRDAKAIKDFHDTTGAPWVSDEPMGASETNQPGKRSNVPLDFAYFAGIAALEGAGATFHSDAGILSQPFGPVQRACAQAFYNAMRWTPAEAPTWPYQRGAVDEHGVPIPEGIGNMPILHDDNLEDRSYCKGGMLYEWCVQERTVRQHATPRDGWVVLEEPQQGFVKLGR